MSTKIYSWNFEELNTKKADIFKILENDDVDLICCQSVYGQDSFNNHISELPYNYKVYFNDRIQIKGNQQTCIIYKEAPINIITEINDPFCDSYGLTMIFEYEDIVVINCNVPSETISLTKKVFYCNSIHRLANEYRNLGKYVIITGNFLIAATSLDHYHNEKYNEKGFRKEDRDFMARLKISGYIDTFREMHPDTRTYTHWSKNEYKPSKTSPSNYGWRFEYCFVSDDLKDKIISAEIHSEFNSTCNCPISLELSI